MVTIKHKVSEEFFFNMKNIKDLLLKDNDNRYCLITKNNDDCDKGFFTIDIYNVMPSEMIISVKSDGEPVEILKDIFSIIAMNPHVVFDFSVLKLGYTNEDFMSERVTAVVGIKKFL